MTKLKVEWIEVKAPDWKLATLIGEDGKQITEVSINRTSKKGEVFPSFDELASGHDVEGELWQSTAGKWYLFPPRPQTTPGGASRGQGGAYKAKVMEEAMARKEVSIGKFQASKEESIKLAGCQRDAVLLTQTMFGNNIWSDPILSEEEKRSVLKKEVIKWRDWLLSDAFNDVLPFSKDGEN